ncbi:MULTISPECIES: hypothetical protein [unclassified Nostoc]|uniref:hypothetical protein n=1 Tax=unclassified Nostoc TaxID=2593658 RepID=UPI002AD412AD|nr:hypothetical protein [Nostoc sp. DedQUE03]MDZ7973090.1 hypothetical protein [Nostoc sp. DedQUE03]MDZ8042943.1 hypothetical protein [Nostoc sp. DedQUE02]
MNAKKMLREQLEQEYEFATTNMLNEVGNKAIKMGLIVGHGYHKGKYEILQQGKAILLPPKEAFDYLQNLIAELEK